MRRGLWLAMVLVFILATTPAIALSDQPPESADTGTTSSSAITTLMTTTTTTAVTSTTTTATTTSTVTTTTTTTSKLTTTTAAPAVDRGVATGKFVWPVPGWTHIVQGYGDYHPAIDVYDNAMLGTPILAVDGGTVVIAKSSGYNNGAGTYIQIDHGNGYRSHYCHCSEILFSTGDQVAKGEVIAYVGQSGNTSGPGLHLEMWKNDVYIDPLSVLPY